MSAAPEETTVLVADDDAQLLGLVARRLKGMGFTVVEAMDGDKAWDTAQEVRPDLVVLDVMMPGMSGWEVCRRIRESEDLSATRVIMLTGIGSRLNEYLHRLDIFLFHSAYQGGNPRLPDCSVDFST